MHTDNQTLIILFLGVALLVSLYLGTTQFTEFILGIFGGIFMQKTVQSSQKIFHCIILKFGLMLLKISA